MEVVGVLVGAVEAVVEEGEGAEDVAEEGVEAIKTTDGRVTPTELPTLQQQPLTRLILGYLKC